MTTSRAVLFDAVGTLIYAEPSVDEVYEQIGRRFGSRHSLGEIGRRFRSSFAAEEEADRNDPECRTSEEREVRRWQAIVAAVLDDVEDREAAFQELWRHFARPVAWEPYEDAIATIAELSRRGVQIGVASNFDARLGPIIAAHFPKIRSDRVWASSQLGYRKPAVNFFLAAASSFDDRPLFVGDDVVNDFHGARSAGLQALLIDRDSRHPEIAPRISDLRQLLDLR